MSPEEYRAAQDAIDRQLRRVLMALLHTLRGRPSSKRWQEFLAAAYPTVYRARLESWQLAANFYAGQRRFQLVPATGRRGTRPAPGNARPAPGGPPILSAVQGGGAPQVPRRNYSPRALAAAMRPVRARLDALDDGVPLPHLAMDAAARIATRHAADAGREAIVDAARHDPAALGYARRTTSADPCAFCLMLASRGPVYKGASTALLRDGTGEPYHDGCSCVPIPVFHRDRWPGREEYEQLERQWHQHGGTLADWRRYIDAQRSSSGIDNARVA